jgi:hypothetical protein
MKCKLTFHSQAFLLSFQKLKKKAGTSEYDFETEGNRDNTRIFMEDMCALEEEEAQEDEHVPDEDEVADDEVDGQEGMEILDECRREAIDDLGNLPAQDHQGAVLILAKVSNTLFNHESLCLVACSC